MRRPATALLTFRIGPVHTFIAQARRVADLWTGSAVLSRLIEEAIRVVLAQPGCAMVFPFVPVPAAGEEPRLPAGLPNRFVARVPAGQGAEIAARMRAAVEERWNALVGAAAKVLERYDFVIDADIWSDPPQVGRPRQTDHVLEIAWSLVEEPGDYAAASLEGARIFTAARRFRPFPQIEETGEKCAVCGERTALPNGIRQTVRDAWVRAEALSRKSRSGDHAFFRLDQTRLCLVCSTKRLYPKVADCPDAWFSDFRYFEPREDERGEGFHYFALLKVDGDRMGEILSRGPALVRDGRVEELHREVSSALAGFADSLRSQESPNLNLEALGSYVPAGKRPQLIYAGGDDVLVVCDPRDALPLALRLRARYEKELLPLRDRLAGGGIEEAFTVSGAVLFAHTKHPAGLLFGDLEKLLKRKAKQEAGRDALALRLDKRGGVPVEVAIKWDDLGDFAKLVTLLSDGELSSKLTYHLREDEDVVASVFTTPEQWKDWLADRIGRGGMGDAAAREIARLMVPFFNSGRSQALRIVRFLATEVRDWREEEADAALLAGAGAA